MAKITLILDTESTQVEYINDSELDITIHGGPQGFMYGLSDKPQIMGWQLFVTLDETPESRLRRAVANTLLKTKASKERFIEHNVDPDGISTLDIAHRCRLEGAIELCDMLLREIGYEPSPIVGPIDPKEPNDGEAETDSG